MTNHVMKIHKPFFIHSVTFLIALVLMQGCNSTSEPPKTEQPIVTDQDASGLYTGTGTGTFTGVNTGNELSLSTVKGMVDGTRFIFFNADTSNADFNVLYDGQITSITLTALVGTASVYQGGQLVSANVSVTGIVNSISRVQLTLAAKGNFLGGSVDGLFIKPTSVYDRVANNDRIFADGTTGSLEWVGSYLEILMPYPNMAIVNFAVNVNGVTRFQSLNGGTIECDHLGSITNKTKNIYTITETITDRVNCTLNAANYVGLISIVDGIPGMDNEMWYATTNGAFSIFGVLGR